MHVSVFACSADAQVIVSREAERLAGILEFRLDNGHWPEGPYNTSCSYLQREWRASIVYPVSLRDDGEVMEYMTEVQQDIDWLQSNM